MGFGLHAGWAVEGAIGSSFKIDASYLSPNVNMASRLEAATKQFGVYILFSGSLFDTFITNKLIDMCRHIDTVKVKGSDFPLRLFTIDLNILNVNRTRTQNKNFIYRLNSFKSSLVNTLRINFLKLAKKNQSEEHNMQGIKDDFEEDNEDLPTIEVLNQFSFKEILLRDNEEDFRKFREFFDQGLLDYLGTLTLIFA